VVQKGPAKQDPKTQQKLLEEFEDVEDREEPED
jgi:hypothetical protein